jgi:hypothetical protein
MSDEHRTKIANSQILNRLIGHVEGHVEMSGTQVTAALGLLKKVMPDLQSTQISGDPENPVGVSLVERVIIDPAKDKH